MRGTPARAVVCMTPETVFSATPMIDLRELVAYLVDDDQGRPMLRIGDSAGGAVQVRCGPVGQGVTMHDVLGAQRLLTAVQQFVDEVQQEAAEGDRARADRALLGR